MPFPFVFYRCGSVIREKCKYAAESDRFMRKLRERASEGKKGGMTTGEPIAAPNEEIDLERSATL